MSIRQAPRNRGEVERLPHFVHVKTANNERWHAYVAGPCHWFECHSKGRTKPCLHAVTGGELVCEKCEACQPVDVVGYQPLFREVDTKPCFVVVHDSVREQIDALKFHARVMVGRAGEKSDGVYVVPALNPEPRFSSALVWKNRPVDLIPSLLRIWSVPDLIEWYRQTSGRSDIAVSQPGAAEATPPDNLARSVPPLGNPTTEQVNNARTLNEEFVAMVKRGELPTPVGMKPPNGKHKPR